jgi:hypothetical protein
LPREGHTNRGTEKPLAPWSRPWRSLKEELEDRGFLAIRRKHIPHEAKIQEGLVQKGKDLAMKDMIMGSIQDAFTSSDPKMAELRS